MTRGGAAGLAARVAALGVTGLARVVTGVTGEWRGCTPDARPRVYYANHASHGDFVLIWAVMPPDVRHRTRPVAAADYWGAPGLRGFFGREVFDAVLVARGSGAGRDDPVGRMAEVLAGGSSLILFPEGTRNTGEEPLLPFRGGLERLALRAPEVEFVPTWIANLNRVMPKGEVLPVPLLCSVVFGTPQRIVPDEPRGAFTERARAALLALAPEPRT